MSNEFGWLIATTARGHLVSATAADDEVMVAGFLRVHELSGHQVEQLTFDEARERFRAGQAPARERYYAQRPPAAAVPELPPVGEVVTVPLGVGTVITHLRWPDHHPTHAGQVAALVRGAGFESAVFPEQIRRHVPAPEPPPAGVSPPAPALPQARPATSQPPLF